MPHLTKADKKAKISTTEARRRKEVALMELRELESAQRSARLIDFEASVREVVSMVKIASSQLEGMCSRLAPAVAAENNPAICQSLMLAAVHETLTNLSNYPAQCRAAAKRKRKGQTDGTP